MPDGPKWLLRYPIACYEYGSRLEECVDCEIPIAAKNYDVAFLIAKVILREHVAPAESSVDPPPAEMSLGIQWGKKSQVSYT